MKTISVGLLFLSSMSASTLLTEGLENHGVRLIGPVDPAFQTTLHAFGGSSTSMPTVILLNQTTSGIAGCAVTWTIVGTDGKTSIRDSFLSSVASLKFERVNGDPVSDPAIPSGGSHLFTPFSDVSPSQSLPVNASGISASHVTATLDAVLLDDGTFFGKDVRGFSKLILGQLAGERRLRQQIIKNRNAGMTTDQIFVAVQAAALNNTTPPDHVSGDQQAMEAYFFSQFARQLVRIRSFAGENVFNEVQTNFFVHSPQLTKIK